MDDKIFKEQLSKIAKWYTPIVTEGSSVFRKPAADHQVNELLGPIIQELHPCLKVCPGCDKIADQRVSHTLRFTSIDGRRPKRRWEHNCHTCKKLLDPVTFRAKEKPKSKYQLDKEAAAKARYWWNEGLDGAKKSQ